MYRWAVLPVLVSAAFAQNADGIAFFETNIRPLLAANCYGCRSAKLDGQPDESPIVAAIRQSGNVGCQNS